jgi:hypothetical protein
MGRKLTVFMIDGSENGPRTIEIGNWSGKAIYSPRAKLIDLLKRSEFDKPGVYLLKFDPVGNNYNERIYIGEAEKIGVRLKQHINNPEKDFKECIAFISKDDLLTKSHIKYMESRLVNIANEAKNAEIENGNIPTESFLSEADISDMEYFIEQIKLILPINGFYGLVPNTITKENKKKIDEEIKETDKYVINAKNVTATLYETSEGFIVIENSFAVIETTKSINENWIKLRNKLIETGNLVKENDKYRFAKDTLFSSLSAASSTVLGRQSNGSTEWKTENGKTYKQVNEEKT